MKPHELLVALMSREGIGSLPLAKKLGRKTMQSAIHRFTRAEVTEPARSTAQPLAAYFKIPIEALYDEKAATAVAKERGLEVVPLPPPKPRRGAVAPPETVHERYDHASAEKQQIIDFLLRPRAELTDKDRRWIAQIEADYAARIASPEGTAPPPAKKAPKGGEKG